MTLTRWLLIFLATLTLTASGHDLDGTWRAPLPPGEGPKSCPEFVFELTAAGDQVTGKVHMGNWPGEAPVSEGKIEGGRFSFVAVGRLWSSSGYPKLRFIGTVKGNEMELVIYFGYVGGAEKEQRWELTGWKVLE